MTPLIADLARTAAGIVTPVARRMQLRRAVALSLVALFAGGGASAAASDGWDHLGTSSLDGTVHALHPTPGALYAGGNFTHAGGIHTGNVARWDGHAWSALGTTPLGGVVHAIAHYAGKIYAGGYFNGAGRGSTFLAVWNGVDWRPFCRGPGGESIGGNVLALQVIGSTLFVGGAFQDGAGLKAADYLMACDLKSGAPRAIGSFSSSVLALTADNYGTLYAGGGFHDVENIGAADLVASYDGAWHAMGSGPSPGGGAVTDWVRSLASNGTDVFIGSDAINIAGIPNADHVAKWNGSGWSAVGSNAAGTNGWLPTSATIDGIAASGPAVFVAGSFQDADGNPKADMVAAFIDPALGPRQLPPGWSALGSNGAGNGPLAGGQGRAVTTFGERLIAGGGFTSAGGDTQAFGIAAASLSLWPGIPVLPAVDQVPLPCRWPCTPRPIWP